MTSRGERVELIDHRVDGVLELENLALHIHRDLARKIAIGHGSGHCRDVSDLRRQVAGHGIHAVGKILPDAANAFHLSLAAQLAFRSDFARHARDFRREGVQLIDHRVDGVLQFQNFALDVHRDFARKIAVRHRRGHFRDVADLGRKIAGHRVDAVGQILPDAADALHLRLAAQLSFGADLARHARDFRTEAVELIDHRVDGVLQLKNFAARIHRDLGRKIASGDGGGHAGDIAHLVGQVAGHRVHALREIFPRAGDALNLRLPAQFAVRADLARHARNFRSERAELIDHRVDGVLELENFAAHRDRDLARKIAVGHRGRDFRDVADLAGEIARHGIHAVGEIFPGSGNATHIGLTAENTFRTHLARHARHFRSECVQLIDHRVDGVLELKNFAAHIHRDLAGKVAIGDRRGDFGDVSDLRREITGHRVHAVGEVFPDARDALHFRLAAQLAFGSDFARHAGHFGSERSELIHHRIDRVLEFEDLALHIHRDFAREIAIGHRGGDFRDVADLRGEIARHRIDAVREILPDAGDALHHGLTAQLAFRADFARHARYFRSEGIQLRHHGVHHARRVQELAFERAAVDIESHGLRKVALGHRADHAGDFGRRLHQIPDQAVDRIQTLRPIAGRRAHAGPLVDLAFLADRAADPGEFARHAFVQLENIVERVGDLARDPGLVNRQANRKIAVLEGDQRLQQRARVECVSYQLRHQKLLWPGTFACDCPKRSLNMAPRPRNSSRLEGFRRYRVAPS